MPPLSPLAFKNTYVMCLGNLDGVSPIHSLFMHNATVKRCMTNEMGKMERLGFFDRDFSSRLVEKQFERATEPRRQQDRGKS